MILTLNVERRVNGKVDPDEMLNQSQVYVTTAGFKNTFSYNKLIQILCQMVARPDSFILGGTWRVPVMEHLLNKDFVKDLRLDGTFNEASFEREYESVWSGSVDGAFFDPDIFDKSRTIKRAETKPEGRSTSVGGYYVMGVDVGRHGCTTEAVIMKVSAAGGGVPKKQIVNIYTFDEEHFGIQSRKIKRLFKQYNCKIVVVDANGLTY